MYKNAAKPIRGGTVFFSEELVLLPKLSWGALINMTAEEHRFRSLPNHKVNTTYRTLFGQRRHALVDPKTWQDRDISKHRQYAEWNQKLISDTLGPMKALNPEFSEREFDNMCVAANYKFFKAGSYVFHRGILLLIRQLVNRGYRWGVISNTDPQFADRLHIKNERLPEPLYDRDLNPPIIINAVDSGLQKPHAKVFIEAARKARLLYGRDLHDNRLWYIGTNPKVDVPRVSSSSSSTGKPLPFKNVLVTDSWQTPMSDIKGLTTSKQIIKNRHLTSFKVADIRELFTVFGLTPPSDLMSTPELKKWTQSKEVKENSLWNVLNDSAIKAEKEEEEATIKHNT